MLKDLLETTFKTLCRNVFSTYSGNIRQTIPEGEFEGQYIAPADGAVRLTGHCEQLELRNETSGQSYSFTNESKELIYYKDASVFVRKGDRVFWHLSRQNGRNTYLSFMYSYFSKH